MTQPVETKKWHLILLAAVILAAVGFKIYGSLWTKHTVRLGGEEFRVLVADTQSHRVTGWSKRKDMGAYGGMLFVFPERRQHTMVMRSMLFPLDIIWIDGRTIVDMAPNVLPEPGKSEAELTPYFARLPSTLVLELPAGFIKAHSLKIGDQIEILF
ncbi:MAG: DUF192 domain-containing protein [Candidatus Magasanikbacteria bacterium]|nr:DUF192 domain-containing protein [Candidatus Magasanikbacteria bacterium]